MFSFVCDVFVVAASAMVGLLLVSLNQPIAVLSAVPSFVLAAFFAYFAIRRLRAFRQLRDTWRAGGIPPWAMRMSGHGLEINSDADSESVFLPWGTVQGFRSHQWRRQHFIVVDIFPGVDAKTPGVIGLEAPDVQRALRKHIFGTKGLRFALRNLDQPVSAVDHAAAYFTAGRVRVH
ncbi:hypothetical protein OG225_38570 [Nocardia sp. NBC_01377]